MQGLTEEPEAALQEKRCCIIVNLATLVERGKLSKTAASSAGGAPAAGI